jgi:pyruvate/2-oxoglutarate dehydrogenase complex dihydrolipoamide acyltransferase (E2) component
MAISVVMPALEMARDSSEVISRLKREGDTVSKGSHRRGLPGLIY